MPFTVNVNNRSVVHASSSGQSPAFPDPCKTPTPGGPVPIPYPNIAMSSDTDGTSSVKVDGASAMVKGASFRMSSGDEAGSALGVVSNKIKGKAEFTMYAFDVKFEGKNACRLGDPMQQNMGSGNAVGVEMQGMKPGMATGDDGQAEACEKAKKNQKKEGRSQASAWASSGIISEHQAPIQEVVTSLGLKVIFRATKAVCGKWIRAGYQPKPHDIIAGTTIKEGATPEPWLAKYAEEREERVAVGADLQKWIGSKGASFGHYENSRPPAFAGYAVPGAAFIGIVGSTKPEDSGRPLLANRPAASFSNVKYGHKYVTGDYDLYDVLIDRDPQCRRALQDGSAFAAFQREANKKMGYDGIQHGPQSQWNARAHGEGPFSIPDELVTWLRKPGYHPTPKVPIAPGRTLDVVDGSLTVVNRQGAAAIEGTDEAKDFLVCCGCKKPAQGVN